MIRYIVSLVFFVSTSVNSAPGLDLDFELVASNLGSPTDVANAGDDRLFVVDGAGLIRIVDADGNVLSPAFLDIAARVLDGGERGLLGLAFHPDYANNGYFYVNYTREPDGDTVIARFSVSSGDPNVADAGSELQLLTVNQPASNHNAGAMAFDPGPEGYLYIPLGDGGPSSNARNMTNLLGTIVRIDVDSTSGTSPDCVGDGAGSYTVPGDNPFSDGPGGTCDEAWAFGLRNPFKMSIDRDTGDLYLGDVGESSFEEVDFQPAGLAGVDWGWRCKEGFSTYSPGNCDAPLSRDPFFAYGRAEGRSVIGGYVYRGTQFPNLEGVYFFNDYYERTVWAARRDQFDSWEVTRYGSALPDTSFSSWGEGADGELYVVKRDFSGPTELYRLVDNTPPNEAPVITEGDSVDVTLDEDSTPQMFSLTLNATDDGGPENLIWGVVTSPSGGSASTSGSGSNVAVNYTPDNHYSGSDTFQVAVADPLEAFDVITVNVTIRPRNDAPNNTQPPAVSGEPTSGSTLSTTSGDWNDNTDSTPGNLSYSYQWESSSDNQSFSAISGETQTTYELTQADEGRYIRASVTATDDGEGLPATQSATAVSSAVEVLAPNDPPIISEGAALTVTLDEDASPEPFALTLNATDDGPEADLSWSISTGANNGSAAAAGSGASVAVDYTPNENFNGTDQFVVTVTDGRGASDSITVDLTIRPRNDAPVNTLPPTIAGVATVGAELTADEGVWNDSLDLSPGNLTFAFQWQRASDNVSFADISGASDPVYTVEASDEGQFLRFEVTVTDDGEGLPSTQQVSLFSASAEVFLSDPPPRILEGPAIVIVMDEDAEPLPFGLNLRASDDGPSSELSWTISTEASNGTAGVDPSGTPTSVSYEPIDNYHGEDSFEVTVTDGSGQTDSIEVRVSIQPRNDPPQNEVLPVVLGIPEVGETITAEPGQWSDALDSNPDLFEFTYQWQSSSDGVAYTNIPAADASEYIVDSEQEGNFIRVSVTASDDGVGEPLSQSATAVSSPVTILPDIVFEAGFETTDP